MEGVNETRVCRQGIEVENSIRYMHGGTSSHENVFGEVTHQLLKRTMEAVRPKWRGNRWEARGWISKHLR